MFFVADDTMHFWTLGRVSYWSVSTPMARTPVAWHAASRAPLPVRPPAPKMTSAPLSIICFAALLPWGGSVNEVVYTKSTLMSGLTDFAPSM